MRALVGMSNKSLLLTVLAIAAAHSDARAEVQTIRGASVSNKAACHGFMETAATARVEYFADAATGLPSTGDVTYVRALVYNLNDCGNDNNGFFFKLPQGAVLSTQDPILCYRGNHDGYHELPTTSTSACLTQPIDMGARGWFVGYSELAPVQFLEIWVPVLFTRRLDGVSAASLVQVETTSIHGSIFPKLGVAVAYRPAFLNHSASVNNSSATVQFDVNHFYEAAVLDVAWGTDPNYLPYGTPTESLSNVTIGHVGKTATLSNLPSGATIYWRARLNTALGTFLGPVQSFTTPYATLTPVSPFCRRWGC